MKIAWTRMKGVCLLLLGLATTGGGRSFAADINTRALPHLPRVPRRQLPERQPPVRSRTNRPARRQSRRRRTAVVPGTSGLCAFVRRGVVPATTIDFAGAPGRFWFRGEYLHWWTSGAHLPPMVSTLRSQRRLCLRPLRRSRIRDGSHDGYRIDIGSGSTASIAGAWKPTTSTSAASRTTTTAVLPTAYANGKPSPIVRLVYRSGDLPASRRPARRHRLSEYLHRPHNGRYERLFPVGRDLVRRAVAGRRMVDRRQRRQLDGFFRPHVPPGRHRRLSLRAADRHRE